MKCGQRISLGSRVMRMNDDAQPWCAEGHRAGQRDLHRLGHSHVGTGHLLLGLLEEAEGAFQILCKLGIVRLGCNLSLVAEHVVVEMDAGFPCRRAARPFFTLPIDGRLCMTAEHNRT